MKTLEGKVCLITGITSGIGKQVALELARLGATIAVAGRNYHRNYYACQEIIEETGNKNIEFFMCDLSSFTSVKSFTQDFKNKFNRLDILINNAGIWGSEYKTSVDGIELTLETNHLGPFLLTLLLLDILEKTGSSRIINVSSSSYKLALLNFDNLELKEGYNGFFAYSQSKYISMLVDMYLAEKIRNTGVTLNSIHPGVVYTGIFKSFNPIIKLIIRFFMYSPKAGAAPIIYLATSDKVEKITGVYFNRFHKKRFWRKTERMQKAKKLWDISINYIKEFYEVPSGFEPL